MSSVPVIKFLFQNEWKVLSDALKLNQPYESELFDNANDLTTYISGTPAGLIVACLKNKDDLIQIATFMKLVKKVAPNSYFKVIVINFSADKQFEKAIAKLGIFDMVDDRIQVKALRFKIDFLMKSINAHLKKIAAAQANSNNVKSLESNKNTSEKKVPDNAPNWQEALDCEDDIWLLRNEVDCKKVLTRWMVKFMGPSPYVANWVDTGTSGIWKFEFRNEGEDFIFGNGIWYYRGEQKPDFIWSENSWLFTGSSFELFYKQNDDIKSRLKLKDKVLTIARNSDYAKTKESKIVESFDKELVFKKDQASKLEMETTDKEREQYQNLEGKGKTDNLQGGPLSGKGKTDALQGGPLSGKGKTSVTNTDPLAMDLKPGENSLSSAELAQKTQTGKEKTHWNGKNAYEKEGKADFGMKADQSVNQGPELSMDGKGTHQKYYKNHNEAEKFDAKELGGKSSTDEIEGHLTSPDLKKAAAKEDREKEAGTSPFDREAREGSKGGTDKLDGHLRSPDAKGDRQTAEKSGKDYSGKSTTDKLDGHLGSPEAKHARERQEREASGLGGKSSTDKLPGHLGGPSTKAEPQGKEKKDENSDYAHLPSLEKHRKERPEKSIEAKETKEISDKPAKVLPFKDKDSVLGDDKLSADLEEAIQEPKVTSTLIHNGKKVECSLDDYFEETIIFSSDDPAIVGAKSVSLNLNFNYMNKDTNLKFEGSVTKVEPDGEGANFVTVEISKENASAFNSFMKLYSTRQEHINLFLKTVKGQ